MVIERKEREETTDSDDSQDSHMHVYFWWGSCLGGNLSGLVISRKKI